MWAVGGAVCCEGGREREVTLGVEGDGCREDLQAGSLHYEGLHSDEVVEDSTDDGHVGGRDDSIRRSGQQNAWGLGVGSSIERAQDEVGELAAGGESVLIRFLEMDAAVDAAAAGFVGGLFKVGECAFDRQAGD